MHLQSLVEPFKRIYKMHGQVKDPCDECRIGPCLPDAVDCLELGKLVVVDEPSPPALHVKLG